MHILQVCKLSLSSMFISFFILASIMISTLTCTQAWFFKQDTLNTSWPHYYWPYVRLLLPMLVTYLLFMLHTRLDSHALDVLFLKYRDFCKSLLLVSSCFLTATSPSLSIQARTRTGRERVLVRWRGTFICFLWLCEANLLLAACDRAYFP